jgi:hypothetical protein
MTNLSRYQSQNRTDKTQMSRRYQHDTYVITQKAGKLDHVKNVEAHIT